MECVLHPQVGCCFNVLFLERSMGSEKIIQSCQKSDKSFLKYFDLLRKAVGW